MRYTNWADVVARYPSVARIAQAEATAVDSAFIAGAESEVDATLSGRYAVPFASTPTLAPGIIRDVSTDMAYMRIAQLTLKPEQLKILQDSINRRLGGLATGSIFIIGSGGVVQSVLTQGAWGTHQSYPNITGVDTITNWGVSNDEMNNQTDKRDNLPDTGQWP